MHLEQDFKAELMRAARELGNRRRLEDRRDKEDDVRAGSARLEQLIFVDDEVFS